MAFHSQAQPPATATEDSLHAIVIKKRLVAFGHLKPIKPRVIDAIIIHGTWCAQAGQDSTSVECILQQFKRYGVSAHYLIGYDSTIYQLVNDEHISYHAGKSKLPNGVTSVNEHSLGIEVNHTVRSGPTQAQYRQLAQLVAMLQLKHPTVQYVMGHGDIAPGRKTDPWHFDWTLFNNLLTAAQQRQLLLQQPATVPAPKNPLPKPRGE